ncbi:MAG: alkaline phosphatase family protein [Kiloniellales bacterium]
MDHAQKFLVVGMDGFRPEMMSEPLTPNLWRLARRGVEFKSHRCCFPSETYVNLPSLVTGTPVSGHGIVANYFLDPKIHPRRQWKGSYLDLVEAGMRAYEGKLFTAPTLGEILGEAGRSMAVISANSAGSVRLKHPAVGRYASHLCFAVHDTETSLPRDRVERLVAGLGPLRQEAGNSAPAQSYATDAFLALVEAEGLPDLTILWYGEPDNCYHSFGIGSDEARRAITHVDAELGRLLDGIAGRPGRDSLNVLVTSDHAHITQTRQVDTRKLLEAAGFTVGDHLEDGAEVALVPGYCSNARVRDGDPTLVEKLCRALMEHPDVGMIFTAGRNDVEGVVEGTFAQSLVFADHARSPHVYFMLATNDDHDHYGFEGTCLFDNELAAGAGIHGGLHHKELNNLLVAQGPAFAEARVIETPSSITDIAPTILSIMGLEANNGGGRPLSEALRNGEQPAASARPHEVSVSRGGYGQSLARLDFAGRDYLHGGRRS